MISMRWAAACTLAFVTMIGCQKTVPIQDPAPAPAPTSDEKVAAAKAKYAAMPGVLVGEVEAANDTYAAIGGLDPKSIGKDDILTFIDVAANEVISHGTMSEVGLSGRLVVKFDPQGQRAPKKGDLCVKLK